MCLLLLKFSKKSKKKKKEIWHLNLCHTHWQPQVIQPRKRFSPPWKLPSLRSMRNFSKHSWRTKSTPSSAPWNLESTSVDTTSRTARRNQSEYRHMFSRFVLVERVGVIQYDKPWVFVLWLRIAERRDSVTYITNHTFPLAQQWVSERASGKILASRFLILAILNLRASVPHSSSGSGSFVLHALSLPPHCSLVSILRSLKRRNLMVHENDLNEPTRFWIIYRWGIAWKFRNKGYPVLYCTVIQNFLKSGWK